MGVGVAERVQQPDGVARHVAEVVLPAAVATLEQRHGVRRRIAHVGRPASVPVVEPRHSKATSGQRGDEIIWP